MIMKAFEDQPAIQKVYNKLKKEDTLSRHFGSQFSSWNISPGCPDGYVAGINVSTNNESYEIINWNLGTFE